MDIVWIGGGLEGALTYVYVFVALVLLQYLYARHAGAAHRYRRLTDPLGMALTSVRRLWRHRALVLVVLVLVALTQASMTWWSLARWGEEWAAQGYVWNWEEGLALLLDAPLPAAQVVADQLMSQPLSFLPAWRAFGGWHNPVTGALVSLAFAAALAWIISSRPQWLPPGLHPWLAPPLVASLGCAAAFAASGWSILFLEGAGFPGLTWVWHQATTALGTLFAMALVSFSLLLVWQVATRARLSLRQAIVDYARLWAPLAAGAFLFAYLPVLLLPSLLFPWVANALYVLVPVLALLTFPLPWIIIRERAMLREGLRRLLTYWRDYWRPLLLFSVRFLACYALARVALAASAAMFLRYSPPYYVMELLDGVLGMIVAVMMARFYVELRKVAYADADEEGALEDSDAYDEAEGYSLAHPL
jgi:hypothetical protein